MKRPALFAAGLINLFVLLLTPSANSKTKKENWLSKEILLNETTAVKHAGPAISIPPRSRTTITFTSYCLNPRGAAPHGGEKFIWSRQDTKIPYLKKVLAYAGSHPEIRQTEIQSLIWSLARGVWFESYPIRQKEILIAIDPTAPLKLPSRAREEAKRKAKGALFKAVPVLKDIERMAREAEREFRSYENIARQIRQSRSEFPLDASDNVHEIEATGVYAETQSHGFAKQTITFFNPASEPKSIDPSQYHLQARRSDVQGIGLLPPLSETPEPTAPPEDKEKRDRQRDINEIVDDYKKYGSPEMKEMIKKYEESGKQFKYNPEYDGTGQYWPERDEIEFGRGNWDNPWPGYDPGEDGIERTLPHELYHREHAEPYEVEEPKAHDFADKQRRKMYRNR